MSSFVLCVGCGAQLYEFSPCKWCTCERCGNDLRNGFCSLCNSGNSYVYDPNPNSFDYPSDSYHLPHPTYETYSYDSYGNDSQFGYDCQPQFPLHYESKPGYNENYNSYPYDSSSLPQQYLCCARCGGPHETRQCDQLIFDEPYCKHCGGPHMNYQCQPMNQDSYNSNSLGFDQSQPPQSPVIHQPPQELSIQEMKDLKQQYLDEMKRLSNLEYRNEIKIAELTESFNGMSIEIQKKEKLLQQEQWAYLSTHPSKRLTSFCYDDDDEDYTSAITPDGPVLSTEEPDNSLSMGDEHLDTIMTTESNEFIKADQFEDFSDSNEEFSLTDDDSFSFDKIDYVEASPPDSELVGSEVMEIVTPEVGGIEASNDNPITFYDPIIYGTPPNITPSGESDFFLEALFDAGYESDSSDDQSYSDEDVLEKIVSKPLSEEEIIHMKIDQHPDNAES
nr:pre-mRNA splicing Prp18-interacting factor [Tanacetum cinerariifolium]